MTAHMLVLLAFVGLMAAAAFEDFRRFIIPNPLTIGLLLLWPMYFAAAPSLRVGLEAIACGAAVFAVGAILFSRGYVGGGDVKLLSAAALWAGPAGIANLMLLTGLLGGALALLLLVPASARIIETGRVALGQSVREGEAQRYVPYGVPIAIAAVTVILSPT